MSMQDVSKEFHEFWLEADAHRELGHQISYFQQANYKFTTGVWRCEDGCGGYGEKVFIYEVRR